MKKIVYTIIIAGFGMLLIVVAGLIFSLSRVAFGILLAIGILALATGIIELIRVLRRGRGSNSARGRGFYDDREMPKYRKNSALLSVPERRFFSFLKDFLSPEYFEIFSQVALVSIVGKQTQTSFRNELFRVIDFCIADAKTTEPILLIEINDSSHSRSDRQERDRKVKDICNAAGIRLISFSTEDIADEKYCASVLKKWL